MTIWILALVLFGCLAALGKQQGAIRVSFSLIGIPIAALLAPALARFVKPVLTFLGMSHPLWLWLIAPLVVFIILLIPFKMAGFAVHRKVDVYYRHKASDLRMVLWERLNARLGMALGLVNALIYVILISWVCYALGYWSVQVAPSENDPRWVRVINRLARDVQSTGMHRVAAAVDRLPDLYYERADLAGLLYQNSLLEARLARYPAFLGMSEQQEFKNVAQDRDIMEMRLKGGSIRDFLKNPAVDAIVKNPEMLALVWNTASTNIADIEQYLRTGMSQKFTEPILGRWYFSPGASIVEYRREKPNLPTTETQRLRTWMAERFANTMIVASPDRKILIKEFPQLQATQPGQPLPENQTITGNWRGGGGTYVLSLEGNVERTAQVEGGKLHYNGESLPLVFQREE